MGFHDHGGRVFVDFAHAGALVQLSHHKGRARSGVAQQRSADMLLAHRVLQPAGEESEHDHVTRSSEYTVHQFHLGPSSMLVYRPVEGLPLQTAQLGKMLR